MASNSSSIAFANKLEAETVSFDLKMLPGNDAKIDHRFSFTEKKKLFFGAIAMVVVSVLINCLILLIILLSSSSDTHFHPNSYKPCPEGWKAFSDLKCIKVFDQMTTHLEAFKLCQSVDPTSNLLNIQTEAEQAFMERQLFSDYKNRGWFSVDQQPQLFNPVWLFGRWHNISGRIDFDDGYTLKHVNPFDGYSNWIDGSRHRFFEGRECTQMLADTAHHHHHHRQENSDVNNSNTTGITVGKWVNVRCQQKSAVVCQRLQNWSPVMAQKNMLKSNIQREQQKKEIDSLKAANQVPVGFVYVQLPKEAAPAELWPSFTWQEISSDYSGVFFRVVGEGAAPFGQLQAESSPRLSEIRVKSSKIADGSEAGALNTSSVNLLVPGEWTDGIDLRRIMLVPEETSTSGHFTRYTPLQSMQFKMSNSTVQPVNMGVKLFKRIK